MRKLLLAALLLLAVLPTFLHAQTRLQRSWSNWIGSGTGITFRNGYPQLFPTTSGPGGIGFPFSDVYHYNGARAVAYSDSITGQVKFIATPTAVYSRNYDTVVNGYGLIACGEDTRYGIQVIPFPSGENKFYIIHQFPTPVTFGGLQTRCSVYGHATGNTPGTRYSVLDLDRNNGLGAIISKNNYFPGGGKMGQVRHANGRDLWVVSHGGTQVFVTLINSSGIQSGTSHTVNFETVPGATGVTGLDVSPDGSRIAVTSGQNRKVNLYSFDTFTGLISFHSALTLPADVGSVCFSPDGTKLYATAFEYRGCSNYLTRLFQVDLGTSNPQENIYEIYAETGGSSSFDMQRVAGNRILMMGKYVHHPVNPTYAQYYSIDYPNQPGPACVFRNDAFAGPGTQTFIPNLPNDVVKQDPEAPVTNFQFAKDTSVCLGTYTLQAPAGYAEYRWSNGATGTSIQVSTPGVYTVLAGAAGFTRPSGFGYTRVQAQAQPLDLGRDTLLCPVDSFTLNIPSHFTQILWSDGDTSRRRRVPFPAWTMQHVTVTDANGCRTSDSVCIQFKSNPRANFGPDTVLCAGENLFLQLEPMAIFSSGGSYLWSTGSTRDTLRITQPGTYWGRATYQGCTVSDTIQVNFMGAQTLDAGRDTTLCFGNSVQLTANIPNATYQWSTGETTQSITVQYSSHYWVKVFNGSCWAIDTVKVTFTYPPQIDMGPDRVMCEGTTYTLNGNLSGATYLWQDGSTASWYTISAPGTYWVQVNYGGCQVSDTLRVQYLPRPIVNLGRDTALCVGQALTLNASQPGASYEWSTGFRGSSIVVSTSGSYWLKVTGSNGCITADTIQVLFRPEPAFTLGADQTVCPNQTVTLTVNHPGSYLWSTGSTAGTLPITQPGWYWLDVTRDGCQKRDSVLITHKPMPVVQLGRDTSICEGSVNLLDATNAGASYLWQDGTTAASYAAGQAGTYHVTVNLNGCIRRDTVSIGLIQAPRLDLGRDTVICPGTQILLSPPLQYGNYLWQNGSTSRSFEVVQPGTYQLTISNECGTVTDAISFSTALCEILMPNAFTPNGDGKNDLFRLKYPQFVRTYRLTVYDRRGVMLYQTSAPGAGWDGTYKGREMPTAAYPWRIEYTDHQGKKDAVWGTVVLIR